MSIETIDEEEKRRPWVPQVILGGKEGPPSSNWLSELDEGDIFLARHVEKADKNFELNMFRVIFKTAKSVKLLVHVGDKDKIIRWVDPKVFSKEMIFQEVIGNARLEDTEDE